MASDVDLPVGGAQYKPGHDTEERTGSVSDGAVVGRSERPDLRLILSILLGIDRGPRCNAELETRSKNGQDDRLGDCPTMKDKKIIVGGRSKAGVVNCIHVLITLNSASLNKTVGNRLCARPGQHEQVDSRN